MKYILAETIRRAVLNMLQEFGGEHNHGEITAVLNEIGHRISRRDVADAIAWLADEGFVTTEKLEHFIVAAITADGLDVALGRLVVEGVSRFKFGG